MTDKHKHFLACLIIALIGFTHSLPTGLYASALCSFLREYDKWAYTGLFDAKDTIRDLIADLLGILTALLIWGII